MLPVLIALGLGIAIWENKDVIDGLPKNSGSSGQSSGVVGSNPWGLSDVDASQQAGSFSKTYDESFEKASSITGVPFALIKAHAIRESSLNPKAYHFDNPKSGASYGLLQVEWIEGSNRLAIYGAQYSADSINDGSVLYDPDTSALLGAYIMRDNLNRSGFSLRDAINAYNTGVAESKRIAPANYVDDVLGYYYQLLGQGE